MSNHRIRRYAYRGRLIVGTIGQDLVALPRAAPAGTAPLPKHLRAQVGRAMDEAEEAQRAAAARAILDHRGNAFEPSSRTRALGALERMAEGRQQHTPDSKD